MSKCVCTEVPVFPNEMSEEIRTLQAVSTADNANAKGLINNQYATCSPTIIISSIFPVV